MFFFDMAISEFWLILMSCGFIEKKDVFDVDVGQESFSETGNSVR